ncbi:MAG: HAMP domain-containing histidine kinase, partial [Chloroflexota bacterium]|nr:HAMP domain-containing histidine kinase [Chloroflexota bacterium]
DQTTNGRYEAFLVRLLAGVIFALALIPLRPPRIGSWVAITVAMGILATYVLIDLNVDGASAGLTSIDDSSGLSRVFDQSTSGISWAYIGLAFIAAVGANRQHRLGNLPDWLLVAFVLWTGALLHDALWPSSYSSAVLTTGDLLRLGFTATVAIGSVVELRRITAERTSLLAAEQEYSRQIGELSKIRTDFNRMVIHELGAPAATIRNFTDVLATGGMRPADQAAIVAMMRSESERMLTLIDDVQSVTAVERDEFTVTPRPVAVADILADAKIFITGLGPDHPITVHNEADGETVSADPMRIGQVLRNLVGNAAKYTPAGTPIALRVTPIGPDQIRFEVADEGAGIDAADLEQIFEKYERGNSPTAALVAGKGLGLYLSRRIVRLHGSDLRARSTPGAGAVFSFELERITPEPKESRS